MSECHLGVARIFSLLRECTHSLIIDIMNIDIHVYESQRRSLVLRFDVLKKVRTGEGLSPLSGNFSVLLSGNDIF